MKREGRGVNRGIAEVESGNWPAIGFAYKDEIRLAVATLECLRHIQHGINLHSAPVERDRRSAERAQHIDHDDGIGIRRTR